MKIRKAPLFTFHAWTMRGNWPFMGSKLYVLRWKSTYHYLTITRFRNKKLEAFLGVKGFVRFRKHFLYWKGPVDCRQSYP